MDKFAIGVVVGIVAAGRAIQYDKPLPIDQSE